MELFSVLRAQSVRTIKPRAFDSISAYELVEEVKEKYKFRQGPTTQEIASGSPTNFVFGKMPQGDHGIVIESLNITYYAAYATSVNAVTRSSTDDADIFLNDLERWVVGKYKLDLSPLFPTNYHSQLEVGFNTSLNKRFAELNPFGVAIGKLLRSYGFDKYPDFEPTGFSLHYDGTKPERFASAFSLERRAGAPWQTNKFFAQAPLRTADHIAVLRQIEEWLF